MNIKGEYKLTGVGWLIGLLKHAQDLAQDKEGLSEEERDLIACACGDAITVIRLLWKEKLAHEEVAS